jgi:hypothetical protein
MIRYGRKRFDGAAAQFNSSADIKLNDGFRAARMSARGR